MTPELQKYYEDRFGLMAHKGWADLIEDLTRMKASVNCLEGIKGVEDLYTRIGMLQMLDYMLNLKGISEAAYENLKEQVQTKPSVH